MKILNRYKILFLAAFVFFSCEDEELKKRNFPGWETAVNSYIQLQSGSAANFLWKDMVNGIDFDFRWISIDGANTVEKIEFYVTFEEKYTNPDGDPAVADHGTELFYTISSPAGNREDMQFSIDQSDVYSLFQSATYDYDETGTAVSVWTYSGKLRDVSLNPFVDGDAFTLDWVMTTADGRVFDSWSPSACTELPGSNCEYAFILECGQNFVDPRGVYTIDMVDSYGDGWNGASIDVVVDGSVQESVTITSGSSGQAVVNVAAGATSLSFVWNKGSWDSEATFVITSEHGNKLVTGGPSQTPGAITLNLCLENVAAASVVP